MIELHYPEGATPIDADELNALIPSISLQRELNEFERENIRRAIVWAQKSRKLRLELLSPEGIRRLHKEMFRDVWRWAGKFRTSEKNVGKVFSYQVPEEVRKLCDDTTFQIKQGVEDWHRLAVTFHHRLVWIHPFPNGNGRLARLSADLLLSYNGKSPLSWGYSELASDQEVRAAYLRSLRLADSGEIDPLLKFATKKP